MDGNRKTTSLRAAAAVVCPRKDGALAYRMFEARGISTEGAFLAGPLLLEPDEAVLVELTFGDGEAVRVQARVRRIERDPEPGMDVNFFDVSEAARARIQSRLTASANGTGEDHGGNTG